MAKKKEAAPQQNYKTINNVLFVLHEVAKRDKVVLSIYFLHITFKLAFDFLGLLFLPQMIHLVEQRASWNIIGRKIFFYAAGMLLTEVGAMLTHQLHQPRMSLLRMKVSQELDEMLLNIPYQQFENPEEQNKFQNANSTISTPYGGLTGTFWYTFALISDTVTFLVYLFVSFYMNYFLFALVIGSVIINYLLTERTNKKNYQNKVKMSPYERELAWLDKGITEDSHAKDIRMYEMLPWFQYRIEKAFGAERELHRKNLWNNLKLSFINQALSVVSDAAIYGTLIMQVVCGQSSLADFSLHFSIIHATSQRVNMIIQDVLKLQEYRLAMNDYRSLVERNQQYTSPAKGTDTAIVPGPDTPVRIEFRDVSFRYPNAADNTLSHISFTIEPGMRFSLVGENGAGKSTLIKLLCRLYTPTQGEIFVNGRNYLEYDRESYQKLLSIVFQDVLTYGFMILENVAMRPEGMEDEGQVVKALSGADLYAKIQCLEYKDRTYLVKRLNDQAVELSGGEAQKLAISRALYKDAPIMVLDEPTAALDAFVEDQIYRSFAGMTQGKSTIFISHRLASTRFCDRIVVLKDGRIEKIGTHERLLENCSLYAELYAMQTKGYV